MLELVSLHIPETGGASLQQILRRKYGRRLRLRHPAPSSPWHRQVRSQLKSVIRDAATFPGPRAIHGHFAASDYANNAVEMITFIRDPVEQRISTYHYHRRQHSEFGAVANDEARRALGMDLENFVKYKEPIYSLFIDIPLDRFSFIGLMENYSEDVQKLCERLGVEYIPVRTNSNPSGSDYQISGEWRRNYESANSREMEIYESALRRRKELGIE